LRISLRIPPITSPSVFKELRGDRRSAHPVPLFRWHGVNYALKNIQTQAQKNKDQLLIKIRSLIWATKNRLWGG
jgi:hypothetical protein